MENVFGLKNVNTYICVIKLSNANGRTGSVIFLFFNTLHLDAFSVVNVYICVIKKI